MGFPDVSFMPIDRKGSAAVGGAASSGLVASSPTGPGARPSAWTLQLTRTQRPQCLCTCNGRRTAAR